MCFEEADMRQAKEYPAGVCVHCGKACKKSEIECYISAEVDCLCVCHDCFDALVTTENVMRFAQPPYSTNPDDKAEAEEIIAYCDEHAGEDAPEVKARLKAYLDLYYKDDFVELANPDIKDEINAFIEEMSEEE